MIGSQGQYQKIRQCFFKAHIIGSQLQSEYFKIDGAITQ